MRLRSLLFAGLLVAAPLPALAQSAGAQVQARINEAVASTRGIGQIDGRMVREQGRYSVATQLAPTDGSRQAEAQVTGIVIGAIAWTYGTVAPDLVKRGVRNFFRNLGSPVRFANDVLQFTFEDAGVTAARFGINTTVGVLGLFEVAEGWGLPHHPADFGQTLHSYGVGAGPYLVIPLLGPSTVRDGIGTAVDIFFDPLTYTLDTYPRLGVTAANAIVKREQLIEPLDDLRANSIDYYAALRSAYFQDRAVALRKGRGGAAAAAATDAAFEEFD